VSTTTATIENPFARRRQEAPPATATKLRALTGFEEEALEQLAGEQNVARVSNEILARCHVAPGADFTEALRVVHQMSVLERDAALVRLRVLSVGDWVEHEVACPSCGTKNVASFRLGDLPIAKALTHAAELEVALGSGAAAFLRLPTAKDQEELFEAQLPTVAARKSFLLSRVLKRLGDQNGPFEFEVVHALPSADRSALERALDAALADLDLSMAADCVSCGHRFEEPFDIARFFFRS
jgi:hypothetical protein